MTDPKAAMTPLEILRSNRRWFTDVRDYYILYDALGALEDLTAPLSASVGVTDGWQSMATAPYACHFLAAYWDERGEWVVGVVMRKDQRTTDSYPWLYWQHLPAMPDETEPRNAALSLPSSGGDVVALREALTRIIEAHDANSGYEPSRSVFDRAIDDARALTETEK